MSDPAPADAATSSVWGTPAALAVLMGTSLTVALFGDGIWDALACLSLAGVLAYAGLKASLRRS